MNAQSEPLVQLEGVSKIFRPTKWKRMRFRTSTWKSAAANLSRLPDLRAAASRRCFPSRTSGFTDRRRLRNPRHAGCQPFYFRAQRASATAEIGFIFQAFNLIGDLTVYENVELPLTYRGMAIERTQKARPRSA